MIPARIPEAGWRERLIRTSGTLLGVSSVLAVIALTLEHGFDLPPWMALYLKADLRRRYGLNLIAIKRKLDGKLSVDAVPSPDVKLLEGDILAVAGEDAAIEKLVSS